MPSNKSHHINMNWWIHSFDMKKTGLSQQMKIIKCKKRQKVLSKKSVQKSICASNLRRFSARHSSIGNTQINQFESNLLAFGPDKSQPKCYVTHMGFNAIFTFVTSQQTHRWRLTNEINIEIKFKKKNRKKTNDNLDVKNCLMIWLGSFVDPNRNVATIFQMTKFSNY